MAWGFNQGEGEGWSLKSPLQLMQEAAVVLCQGGGFQVYYNPTRTGLIDDWMLEIMRKVARFCRARESVSHQTETIPQVALLLSREGFYGGISRLFGSWDSVMQPLRGTLHALLELHYSVDVLAEHQLAERLADYPVVVIPEWDALEDGFPALLLDYVRKGGNLLLVGAKTAALFADHLGVGFDGGPAELHAQVQAGNALASAGGLWQRVSPERARPVGRRFATYDTRSEGECAATVARVGKGRIAAIYGPLGQAHYRAHHPVIRGFLGDVMRRVFAQPLVTVDGPPCIDVALRRKGGTLLIHLLNVAGMQESPRHTGVDFIPPVGPLALSVRMPQKPRRVSLAPPEGTLDASWEEGVLRVGIPSLALHTVVAVTM
jgi:hypothetical protein